VVLGLERDLGTRIDHRAGLRLRLAVHEHAARHHHRPRPFATRDQAAIDQDLVEPFSRHAR
jgi:hypothetical protein